MARIRGWQWLVTDKDICHGSVHIKGTRTTVWMIAQDLSNGSSLESIKEAYGISDEVLHEVLDWIDNP